jgi:hypothetical protein
MRADVVEPYAPQREIEDRVREKTDAFGNVDQPMSSSI